MAIGKCFARLVLCAAMASLAVLSLPASAQSSYPQKPIRFVVGFGVGGPTDVIARALANRMGELLGQSIVVDSRPGADSLVATQHVAQSAPDGYTILIASGSHSINASLYPNVKLDPVKDFAPISLIGDAANFLAVHPKVPAKSVQELIAYARKNPGKLNFASTASTTYLQTELFQSMAGIKMTSIPYKGSGPGVTALLGGEVDLAISSIMTLVQHVKAGSVRALAVTSAQRSSLAPDVPTVAEMGVPGYVASTWYGMLAPGKTPPDIVKRLNETLHKALQDPEVRKQMLGQGLEPITDTPEEFSKFIQEDREKWAKVVKESGLQTN